MDERAPATVLGVRCFSGSVAEGAAAVVARARAGGGGYACLCSVHGVVLAHHDPELREALDGASLVFPDGFPVAWLARRAGATATERVPGTDLMLSVFDQGRAAGLRHYLFGSSPEVLRRLRESLLARYPGVELAGEHSPSFTPLDPEEAARDLERIGEAQPDVVWTGFSTPKQDVWMRRHAAKLAPAVVVGTGAAFDFIAGTKKRAPVWMQDASLEWLHRLLMEPRRLIGRYARIHSEFVVRAAVELARRRQA